MSSNLSNLPFSVIYFSSQDEDFPASNLDSSNSSSGWRSSKYPSYPQELGLVFLESENGMPIAYRFTQVHLLLDRSYVSSRLEIFVDDDSNIIPRIKNMNYSSESLRDIYTTSNFRRLGFSSLKIDESLSSNNRRELKTIYLDAKCFFVKFIFNGPKPSDSNIYQQISLGALRFLGVIEPNSLAFNKNLASYQNPIPPASHPHHTNFNQPLMSHQPSHSTPVIYDPLIESSLAILARSKKQAIETEDYHIAKQIKQTEQELKQLNSTLSELFIAKQGAVESEEFDLASELKLKCEEIKKNIEIKIKSISIPGVDLSSVFYVTNAINTNKTYKKEPVYDNDYYPPSSRVNNEILSARGGGDLNRLDINTREYEEERISSPSHYPTSHYPENDNIMERPIVVKKNINFNEVDVSTSSNKEIPNFVDLDENGEHPLTGVPNYLELPVAEPLTPANESICKAFGIINHFGEYRARCLFSKNWSLREAALYKLTSMINKSQLLITDRNENPDPTSIWAAIPIIIKTAFEDKIIQIIQSGYDLLETVLDIFRSFKVPKSSFLTELDQVFVVLLDRLGDGNSRVREIMVSTFVFLASLSSSQFGAIDTGYLLCRTPTSKQKSNPRGLCNRIKAFIAIFEKNLIDYTTFASSSNNKPFNLPCLLNFLKSIDAYSHVNSEVREATKQLFVLLYKELGPHSELLGVLSSLKKAQREEYDSAIASIADDRKEIPPASSRGGGSNTSSKAERKHEKHQTEEIPTNNEESNFTTCIFCGQQDPQWGENELDLHFWSDCPMLLSCPHCTNVIEIAGLPDHLLKECPQANGLYTLCPITGLSIKKSEAKSWTNNPRCVPPDEECIYCPLCVTQVIDSDEAWFDHIVHNCTKNPRNKK